MVAVRCFSWVWIVMSFDWFWWLDLILFSLGVCCFCALIVGVTRDTIFVGVIRQ